MGAFDDLIPADSTKGKTGAFDDLMPKDSGQSFSGEFADLVPAAPPPGDSGNLDARDLKARQPYWDATASVMRPGVEADTSTQDFTIENIGGPLARGVTSLKREGSMMALLKNAKTLEGYTAIDAGQRPKGLGDPNNSALNYYFQLPPAERAAVRAAEEAKLTQSVKEIAEHTGTLKNMPGDPEVTKALNAETLEDFWEAFKKEPMRFIAHTGLESLPQMLPGLAAAIPAGLALGPGGAAMAMGAGSAGVDYAASVMEALAKRKVDLSDENAIRKAMADPGLLEEAKLAAVRHAAPVGIMDATSVTALARRLGGNFVTRALKQLGIQMTLGAGGEALGQVAAQEGYQPGQVIAEAAGELSQAPVEAAAVSAVKGGKQTDAETRARIVAEEITKAATELSPAIPADVVAARLLEPENAQYVATDVAAQQPAAPQQEEVVQPVEVEAVIPGAVPAAQDEPSATQQGEVVAEEVPAAAAAPAVPDEVRNQADQFVADAGLRPFDQSVPDEDLTAHNDYVPTKEASLTGERLALAELTDRAVQANPHATDVLARHSEGMTDAEYASHLQEIVNANEQDVADRDRGVGAPEEVQGAPATEVERQAREAGERNRADRERREADERESRDRADRERGDFALTGSERTADANSKQEHLFKVREDQLTPEGAEMWPEITRRVQELAARITPTAKIKLEEGLWTFGPFDAGEVAGRYSPTKKLIEVSLYGDRPEFTYRHEAIHALKDMGLLTPQEWKALEAQARKTWKTKYDVEKRWGRYGLNDAQFTEEAIAEAFADFKSGTLSAQPPIQKSMRKIADFFARLGNLLRGMGFQSVDDIFAKIESGEVGRREVPQTLETPDGIKYALGDNVPSAPTQSNRDGYVGKASKELRQPAPASNRWEADAGLVKRMVVTPRTIAAFDADFVSVYQTAVEQWKFRDQLIAKFERAAEPYFKATREDQAVVGKILEHDRLTGQVSLAGQNKTVHFTSPAAELTKPGERLTVTDAQKSAYWSVRNMLNMALDTFRDQTLEDFGLAVGLSAADVTRQAQAATDKKAAEQFIKIAEILQGIEDARRAGYVPFSRYGEVGISVRHPLTNKLTHYETIEPGIMQKRGGRPIAQMPEVAKRLAELRAKYPGQRVSEPFQVPKSGMPAQVKLEEIDALSEMAKIDNATWDSVRAQLEKAVAAQGFRAHFFRSQNTPGYSTDFERGLANYVNGISGYLSRRRFAKRWVEAIAPISANKPRLRQYAQDYQKYVNSPAEEFGFLRSVNFVYYLTSLATWITNLTQVPFVSMPWTTQFASPQATLAAFTRASTEAAAMLTLKNGTQLYSADKAPADVRDAVQAAYDQGLFIPITTYESMGIARNQGRRLRNLSKGAQTAMELVGLGFTMAERQNRIATFIALYRMARDRPEVKENFTRVMEKNALGKEVADNWSPQAFAEFGIDDTHFKSGKVNRPTVARNAGTLVFQFKMFMWNMLERLITQTALQGSEGRAASVLMLMIIGMVSGIWGLPGAENMRDLWELYYKKVKNRDINADAEMRKIIVDITGSALLAQAVSGGATRALPEPWNVDLSKRIGMGKILPSEPGEMLGVTYDLWWKKPNAAMEQFEVDNFLLGLAELSPKQAADFMTQLAWSQAGVRAKTSDAPVIPPEKVTPGMRVVKGIGFTPGNVSNVRDGERAEQVAARAADETRRDLYRRLSKAVADEIRAEKAGNTVEAFAAEMREEAVWADVEKWNEGKPDHLQVKIDRKTAKSNLVKEFEGADYDKGVRRQARGEVERLRQVYGR